MSNLPYDTLGDLAAALIEKHFPGYYSLPYNRYNLGQSQHWWLSPTPDKVAFPYGKAIFSVDPGWFAEGNVFCGFNVEKGLTSEMAEPKNCIMDENWFWHRFVERSAEPLAGRIEEASDAIGQPVQLLVSAGTFMPDDVWSRVSFDVHGNTLSVAEHVIGNGTLDAVREAVTFPDFKAALGKLNNDSTAFQWIDICVGCNFTRDLSGGNDLETCAQLIETFRPWMIG